MKGYGFTLIIWTTGALAFAEHGLPRAEDALAFLGGALVGMALIVTLSFGGLRSTWADIGLVQRAYGAIHVVSVVAAVLAGWLVAALLPGLVAFLGASLVAVVVYNLVFAVEVALSVTDAQELEPPSTPPGVEDEEELPDWRQDLRRDRGPATP